jgi:hypothetical protein
MFDLNMNKKLHYSIFFLLVSVVIFGFNIISYIDTSPYQTASIKDAKLFDLNKEMLVSLIRDTQRQ